MRWLALVLTLAACGDNAPTVMTADAETARAQCDDVRAAYNRLEAQCGRDTDSLYLSVPGNPDCDTVTGVMRPDDVAVCVSWLDWPPDACGELHPAWKPTANCLDLFR